jgi:hypothetical protein
MFPGYAAVIPCSCCETDLPYEMHSGLGCHKSIMKKYGLEHNNFHFRSHTSCMV